MWFYIISLPCTKHELCVPVKKFQNCSYLKLFASVAYLSSVVDPQNFYPASFSIFTFECIIFHKNIGTTGCVSKDKHGIAWCIPIAFRQGNIFYWCGYPLWNYALMKLRTLPLGILCRHSRWCQFRNRSQIMTSVLNVVLPGLYLKSHLSFP